MDDFPGSWCKGYTAGTYLTRSVNGQRGLIYHCRGQYQLENKDLNQGECKLIGLYDDLEQAMLVWEMIYG